MENTNTTNTTNTNPNEAPIGTLVGKTVEGWPMKIHEIEFSRFEKNREPRVHCPKCNSVDIVRDSVPVGFGSAPGGRHRMGDDYCPRVRCNACGHFATGKPRRHTMNGGTVEL